jgi:hypothetical protein
MRVRLRICPRASICNSAPAEASAESVAGAAPLTVKLAPGSAWNAALRLGGLDQSCTQANRANSVSGMPSRFCKCAKREPSSLRVAFAVLDEYASAKPPPLRSVSL